MTTPPTPTSQPTGAGISTSVVERLADDMVARWRRGERPGVEEYFECYPDLRHHPGAALELIAEELALREEFGPPVAPDELPTRFPAWDVQVRALVACHRALGPHAGPRFPEPGDVLGEFRLESELGRGAHARVYLAAQSSLGGRQVVLKLAPYSGEEHLSLARLQHSHIVPLYSAHDFPVRGLRGLCLPYFGGATLAAVLSGDAPADGPTFGAVCRVGVCLADALQYAHDRGLLHLDIKPSNVLIAADGTPMLLDFHLARPPLQAGAAAPASLGGTPGYMAPEHAAAVAAVRDGLPVPADVDARADVYALGVLLGELVRAGGGPASVGLKDILARATAPDARDRYPTAVAFASDLRRHLSDQPLRGVGNRSLPERWRKWRRRRPLALPLILTLAALLSFGVGLTLRMDRQADRARVALGEAEEHLAGGRYAEAERAGRGGEELLDGVPLRGPLRSRLREVRRAAERGLAADELHVLCERVRPLYTAPASAATQVRAAELRCRELWDDRDRLVRLLAGQSPTEAERRWRLDLLDLGILTAHLGVRLAQPGGLTAARRRALDTLAEAEALLGSSPVLYRERAGYARALGMGALADEADRLADRLPPRSAWEYTASGRAALASGDLARASADLDRAVAQEPGSFWPNYHRGVCRLRMGEPAEALASFGACVSLAPANAWCFYNRGLAYAELGRLESARADFDRAIALDRDFEAAYHAKAAVEHRR